MDAVIPVIALVADSSAEQKRGKAYNCGQWQSLKCIATVSRQHLDVGVCVCARLNTSSFPDLYFLLLQLRSTK